MATLTHAEIRRRILALPPALQEDAAVLYHQAFQPVARRHVAAGSPPPQIPETTLYEFVTHRHFLIDRMPFDWPKHQYLIPLYQDFVLDPAEGQHLELVVMKGAQVGLSVWGMLGLLFAALKFPGAWLGYFLPDQGMTDIFSANRFKPLVESNAALSGLLGNEREGINRTRLRNLGTSTILFSYMGGKTSTESAPLLGLVLDEVRRMAALQIGLAEQRISHSPYPINVKLSTAGYPGQDIAHYFHRTDQRYWHTACGCPDGVRLAEIWPECIGLRGGEVFFRCPTCATRIDHPQQGRYIAHVPSHAIHGYHIPQTLSLAPLHTPEKLWQKYTNPQEDRGEFVRSALGRPYVDPEAQLVTEADLTACVDPTVPWYPHGILETDLANGAMGVDQMGGWLDVVITLRTRQHKHQLVHLARLEGDDPFGDGRLNTLMHTYDIACCVCDLNPNYNDAMRFAQRWAPRVFLVTYSSTDIAPMIAWRDRQAREKKTQSANDDEVKFKYIVTIQRYKALDWALGLFKQRQMVLPPRQGLLATVHDEHGLLRPVDLSHELYWPHMQRIVRQKHLMDAEQGTYKMEMIKVGADPHMAFSHLYSAVALSRFHGGRVVIL
jgi:uncharacterized C2H2 Zn-finger protein